MITFALILLMSKAMLQVVQWLGYALLFLVLSGQVRLYKHFWFNRRERFSCILSMLWFKTNGKHHSIHY